MRKKFHIERNRLELFKKSAKGSFGKKIRETLGNLQLVDRFRGAKIFKSNYVSMETYSCLQQQEPDRCLRQQRVGEECTEMVISTTGAWPLPATAASRSNPALVGNITVG